MLRAHMDGALDAVARVIEPHHDLVFADLDRAQLVEHRKERRGLDKAEPIAFNCAWTVRPSGVTGQRAMARRPRERRPGRRPVTCEAFGRVRVRVRRFAS